MMDRSPEEYFQLQNFSTDAPSAGPGEFSAAERAFMEKYLGIQTAATLKQIGIEAPVEREIPSPQPAPAPAVTFAPQEGKSTSAPVAPPLVQENTTPSGLEEEPLDNILKRESKLLMVGFFLGKQEFVVPTLAVQEVIRYSQPAKLPSAPAFVAGLINLRGKITPLIRLREILGVSNERQNTDQFIIVCRRHGLQLGLIIERVHTMYNVLQQDIDWAVEMHLGNVEYISGLLKLRDELVGIVSIDAIVQTVTRK